MLKYCAVKELVLKSPGLRVQGYTTQSMDFDDKHKKCLAYWFPASDFVLVTREGFDPQVIPMSDVARLTIYPDAAEALLQTAAKTEAQPKAKA